MQNFQVCCFFDNHGIQYLRFVYLSQEFENVPIKQGEMWTVWAHTDWEMRRNTLICTIFETA